MDKRNIEPSEKEIQEILYQQMVQKTKPKPPVFRNVLGAFFFGGLICAIGQFFLNFFKGQGLPVQQAGAATSAVLVFAAAFLTGLGIYDSIAKYAGAGTIVPITGFANSMVAPALEFRREGIVLGTGARLFTLAGPVLTFGFVTSWLIGLITYLTL